MSLWSRLVNVIRGDRLIAEIDEEWNRTSQRRLRMAATRRKRGGRLADRFGSVKRAATSSAWRGSPIS